VLPALWLTVCNGDAIDIEFWVSQSKCTRDIVCIAKYAATDLIVFLSNWEGMSIERSVVKFKTATTANSIGTTSPRLGAGYIFIRIVHFDNFLPSLPPTWMYETIDFTQSLLYFFNAAPDAT
jgi:hypothetical protein